MAKRRDTLVEGSTSIFKASLERQYISIYVHASSVVHADCASLSYAYLDLFKTPSGVPVLMPIPSWAGVVSTALAYYDILQCYEILEWVGVPARNEYRQLMDEWAAARDKYIDGEPPPSNAPSS